MESFERNLDPHVAYELPEQPAVVAPTPFDQSRDPYAEAELESRHERIELMIAKAIKAG